VLNHKLTKLQLETAQIHGLILNVQELGLELKYKLLVLDLEDILLLSELVSMIISKSVRLKPTNEVIINF